MKMGTTGNITCGRLVIKHVQSKCLSTQFLIILLCPWMPRNFCIWLLINEPHCIQRKSCVAETCELKISGYFQKNNLKVHTTGSRDEMEHQKRMLSPDGADVVSAVAIVLHKAAKVPIGSCP
jgi:hypothetical protein